MRIAFLVLLLAVTTAQAQVTHYQVKLTPDIDHQLLIGEESIEFLHSPGDVDWQKQPGLHVSKIRSRDGEATVSDASVSVRLHTSGKHRLHLQYTAAPTRGITWFADHAGFDTEFYCEAWMLCDNSPGQRPTLTLEIVLSTSSGLSAAGAGLLKKQWRDGKNEHFVFEQSPPIQSIYLVLGPPN